MPQVIINDVIPRTQIISSASQTVFSTDWTADVATDVLVYARAENTDADDILQLIPDNQYTIDLVGASAIVQVTFSSPRTAGDIVTIVRATPSDRTNLYTNTNFVPSMLNQDFEVLTLVDQQNSMYDQLINPGYNTSAEITPASEIGGGDTILPILPARNAWRKNSTNTGIEAVLIPDGGFAFADGTYVTVEDNRSDLPNSTPLSTKDAGFIVNKPDTQDILSRTITPTALQTTVLDGDGVDGNPTIGIADNATLPGTAGIGIPAGTTAQRVTPTPPSIGLRYNTDLLIIEAYIDGDWQAVGSGGVDFLPLAGGTMSGVIDMGHNKITNVNLPDNPDDAANKAYVDNALSGSLPACNLATTANLAGYVYNNGASGIGATLTAPSVGAVMIDGEPTALGYRVLVSEQSSPAQNGIYTVTTLGTVSVAEVMTRAVDYDDPAEIHAGDNVVIVGGATLIANQFVMTQTATIVIGTTPITWYNSTGIVDYVTVAGTQTVTGLKTFTQETIFPSGIKLTDGIVDSNGNPLISVTPTPVAVNYLDVLNNATTLPVLLRANGSDTDVSIQMRSKAQGQIQTATESDSPIVMYSGTGYQHSTSFAAPNTAASRTVTLQDADGTMAYLSDITASSIYTLIQTQTAPYNNTVTSLTFTGLSGYTSYVLVLSGVVVYTNGASFNIFASIDNGATFPVAFQDVLIYVNGAALGSALYNPSNSFVVATSILSSAVNALSTQVDIGGVGTGTRTSFSSQTYLVNTASNLASYVSTGTFANSGTVNALLVRAVPGNFGGKVSLYGIKS